MQWLRSFVAIAACAGLVAATGCGKKEDDGGPATVGEPPTPAVADAAEAPPVVPDAAAAAAPVDAASGDGDGDSNGNGDGDGDKTATKPPPKKDEAPKNLKVLPKSWSRKKVEDYMEKHISKALGVKCDYCHDEDDYAADSEHKSISLQMMKMERDINRRFFRGKEEVSCYTCHLGKEEPPK